MFRKMLVGAFALVALMAVPAVAQTYDINVNPGTVEPGGDLTITGEGCVPFEEVVITIVQISAERAVGDVLLETTVTADENGEFSVTVQIPEGAAAGTYEVTSSCANVESTTFEIAGGGVTPPPGGGGGGDLPRTGQDLDKLGYVGVGLLVFGGLVLIATKARRNVHAA